jgi:YfiH family protein
LPCWMSLNAKTLPRHMSFIEPDWPAPANVLALNTLRDGGASSEPYTSLNLADHVGDDSAAVVANRATLSQWLPVGTRLQWLEQVHGSLVVRADTARAKPAADASWSREAGQACVVMTADCLPVLFCSRAGGVVAAAHAGWRGLLAGVLENTVAAMGVAPADILAWLGPAIGPAAFEVGPDVRSAFLGAASREQVQATDVSFTPNPEYSGRYLANLYTLARLRLAALESANIFGGDYCTHNDSDRFFSYRRDGQTGRMASVILIKS